MELCGSRWLKQEELEPMETKSAKKTSESFCLQIWNNEHCLWTSTGYTTYNEHSQLVFKPDSDNPSPMLPMDEDLRFVITEGEGKWDKNKQRYTKHGYQFGVTYRIPRKFRFLDRRSFGEAEINCVGNFKGKRSSLYTYFSVALPSGVQFQSMFIAPCFFLVKPN